jgi:hypothetical protein
MDASEIEVLAARVERLESENTWLKRLGALMLAGMAASMIYFANQPGSGKRVVAEEFVVQDSRGQARALLGLKDGQPSLTMLDDGGRDQIRLGANYDRSSTLEFHDRGRLKLAMTSARTGYSSLSLFDQSSALAAGLFVQPDDRSGLMMAQGAEELVLGVGRHGSASVTRIDHSRPEPERTALEALPTLGQEVKPQTETIRPRQEALDVFSLLQPPSDEPEVKPSAFRGTSGVPVTRIFLAP